MSESGKRNTGTYLLIALLLLAFAGSLVYAVRPVRRSEAETEPVFSGWLYYREDQQTAGTAMAKAGLTEYRWDNGRLIVPRRERARYESALAGAKAFPKAPGDAKREALREMGQFEPMAKMRLRDLYSAGWQLEQTLERFSTQIDYATVGVRSRPEQTGMIQKNVVTASVGVWPKDDIPISAELLSAITLATKHHLGITDNADISILDLRHGCSYLGTDAGVSAPLTLEAREDRQRRDYWNEKFLMKLRHIPGVQVSTSIVKPIEIPVERTSPALDAKREGGGLPAAPSSFAVLGNRVPATFATQTAARPASPANVGLVRDDEPRTGRAEVPRSAFRETGARVAVSIGIPEEYIRTLVQEERATAGPLAGTESEQLARKGNEVAELVRQQALGMLREVFVTGGDSPARDETTVRVAVLPASTARNAGETVDTTATLRRPVAPGAVVSPEPSGAPVVQPGVGSGTGSGTGPEVRAENDAEVGLKTLLAAFWRANRKSPWFWAGGAFALLLAVMFVTACSFWFLRKLLDCVARYAPNTLNEAVEEEKKYADTDDTIRIRYDQPAPRPEGRSSDEAAEHINDWIRRAG